MLDHYPTIESINNEVNLRLNECHNVIINKIIKECDFWDNLGGMYFREKKYLYNSANYPIHDSEFKDYVDYGSYVLGTIATLNPNIKDYMYTYYHPAIMHGEIIFIDDILLYDNNYLWFEKLNLVNSQLYYRDFTGQSENPDIIYYDMDEKHNHPELLFNTYDIEKCKILTYKKNLWEPISI